MVQWLGLHTLTAEGPGSIPGPEIKIQQAAQRSGGEKKESTRERVRRKWEGLQNFRIRRDLCNV